MHVLNGAVCFTRFYMDKFALADFVILLPIYVDQWMLELENWWRTMKDDINLGYIIIPWGIAVRP